MIRVTVGRMAHLSDLKSMIELGIRTKASFLVLAYTEWEAVLVLLLFIQCLERSTKYCEGRSEYYGLVIWTDSDTAFGCPTSNVCVELISETKCPVQNDAWSFRSNGLMDEVFM